MSNKNHWGDSAQLSLFDILGLAGNIDSKYSSDEIEEVIGKLRAAKRIAEKHEENERRRREKAEAERKAHKEKERKDAHVREVTCMDLPLDWENAFNQDVRTQGVHAESIPDALIMSLNTLGKVDIEYISSVTGTDYKTVISTLKGSIYQNPLTWNECFYQGWETAEEYLSGNLMRKWNAAKEANKEYNGYFADNIKAIEKVLPPTVATEDIYITLGSPWVPADIIDDFIIYLFGDPLKHYSYYGDREEITEGYKTVHDEITGTWEIPYKSRYNHSVGVSRTYHRFFTICGTSKSEAIKDLSSNDILLDDHSPNLNEWIEAGGKAIKILNEYNGLNGTFVTGPRLKINSTSMLRRALLDVIRQD